MVFARQSASFHAYKGTRLTLQQPTTFRDRFLQVFLPLELRALANVHVHARLGLLVALLWALGLFPGLGTLVTLLLLTAMFLAVYAAAFVTFAR
jgi:hypothetical protein